MDLIANKNNFLEYIHYEKRCSPHTRTAYAKDLLQFTDYLYTVYGITLATEISHPLIRSWIASLVEQKITPRSVNRKITTIKTFYKYLLRQDIVLDNPMLKIQSLKTSKKLPVFIEKEKMDVLLDNIDFGNDFEGQRNKLILELFYATGIRLSELINLKQINVDLQLSQLKVLGKRNKERIVPFNNYLNNQIISYLTSKKNLNDALLFVDKKGNKLYEKFVYRLVNTYLSQVTTVNKKSPHILRHTFATHMLNNGADLNAVKELLGHTSLAATQIYTHNTVEKLKNIYKQAHPKA